MRIATNVFIAVFLLITLIDSFPVSGRRVETLREAIDPIIDVFGIWQGRWDLFSPAVDKENNQIEVRYHFQGDAPPVIWKSPDWSSMNCLTKFRHSRSVEFYDRIRDPGNSPSWKSYGLFLKDEYEKREPASVIRKIEMTDMVETVKSPRDESAESEVKRIPLFEIEFEE